MVNVSEQIENITKSHGGRIAMEQRTTVVWESPTFSPSVVMKAVFRTTQEWQDLLQHNYERLTDVYGNCYRERSAVLLEGLRFFLREMKETSVDHLCVFRSPARINLRGMHVDKHGGACNGVAINRETVFYATHPSRKGVVTLMNKGHGALSIALTDVPRANPQLKQGWEKYVYAAMQATMKEFSLERGFTACVVSDIPQGSGLSSSHSFIVGLLCVLLQFNGIDFRGMSSSYVTPRIFYSSFIRAQNEAGAIGASHRVPDRHCHRLERPGRHPLFEEGKCHPR